MEPVIKAVIFDLDGVIIDSNPAIEDFWKSWADQENIELTDALIREWIYGRKVRDTISGIFDHLHSDRKEEILLSADTFDSSMQPAAIKGVTAFIHQLSLSGIPTGVVTSSHHPRMLKMLNGVGIADSFGHFITGHDVVYGKPHPEPYEKMRIKMGLDCGECLVFEDAVSGIQSARSAGMHCIGIGNENARHTLMLHGAADVVADFTEINWVDQYLVAGKSIFSITG